MEGNRFDPKSYDIKTQNLKSAIFNSQEELKPLASLIVQSVAGDWGIDEDVEERDDYQRCLVIRATEFNNQFNLNLDGNRVKYRLIKKEKLQKIDIQPNDLLIEKSGGSPDQPVGRIAILSEDLFDGNNLCYSNFIHKIRINKSIANPLFVYYFLKTIYNIKLTETMQSQTNGIRNLIMSNYFAQQIPIPNITKQLVIVKNITHIRKKAKQLQYEAKSILDNTKQQVERIIMES